MSYSFGRPQGLGSKRILRGDCRKAIGFLRDGKVSVDQDVLDSDEFIVAATGEVDDVVRRFLQSLPNTHVGLAMEAKKLTHRRCKQALLNKSNFGGSESKRRKFVEENINQDWFSRLRYGVGEESGVKFREAWLSEERTIEVTGVNFQTLATIQAAACDLVYVASVKDLEQSDRAVHYNENERSPRIWLDRRIPVNRSEKSREWRYFPAHDEDGFVPRSELQPSKNRPTYEGDSFDAPEPKFF